MMKSLLTLTIQTRRDILFARQSMRQLCRLLGFDPVMQIKMACAVFELAYTDWQAHGTVQLSVGIDGRMLCVYARVGPLEQEQKATTGRGLRLSVVLPAVATTLSREDLLWVLRQMQRRKKRELFEEIRQQNNDVLQLLLQLQQRDKARDAHLPSEPTAAVA
jgi:hypothetical protein